MNKQRVIVYVDGFNFYYGLKAKGWKKFYWLDLVAFFERMLTDAQELVEVHYFSARPLNDPAAYKRQDALFSANKLNPKFKLTLGKYLEKRTTCRYCNAEIKTYEEKETDVRIATQIINDVYKEKCDISVIVSADSDLVPSIELVRDINPGHIIYVYFPPLRHAVSLENMANSTRNLAHFEARFNQCLLPKEVELPSGYIIKRPPSWAKR